MEEGRVLPISGYFNAVITLPPLSVRDQFCKEAIRQGTVRDSGAFLSCCTRNLPSPAGKAAFPRGRAPGMEKNSTSGLLSSVPPCCELKLYGVEAEMVFLVQWCLVPTLHKTSTGDDPLIKES